MSVIYLILSVFGMATTSVFSGFFNRRHTEKGSGAIYNLLQIFTAFLLWCVLFLLKPAFDLNVLLYAGLFGAFYSICMIGIIYSTKYGSVALTSLLLQFSLIAVTIWGFIFWGSPVTAASVIGLVLVAISLFLCLYNGKGQDKGSRISAKWLVFGLMVFGGNAGCSIVQRTQQTAFSGAYGEFLMMVAMAFATLFCLIIFLKSNKTGSKNAVKKSWFLPVLSGACNVGLNLCVILLATSEISPAIVYPVISVGGLAVSMLFSLFIFKEKLNKVQWIGIAIGAIAVAILSI